MSNPFTHIELQTQDPKKARKFYEALFDWKLQDLPMDYTMVQVGEGTGGGIMKNPVPGAPSNWLPYVLVADVAASTDRAKKLGAKILRDKTDVPGMGAFSVIADPTGAALGLWQAKGK